MRRALSALAACLLTGLVTAAPAAAADRGCRRVVVFALPGVIWSDIHRIAPPELLDAARRGAVGSVSVRVGERSSYVSGFATLGAGNRVAGTTLAIGPDAADAARSPRPELEHDVRVASAHALRALGAPGRFGAEPGALGSALHPRPLGALGSMWPLLSAMDRRGVVDIAAVGLRAEAGGWPDGVMTDNSALTRALRGALSGCASAVVEQGDLARVDVASRGTGAPSTKLDAALRRADAVLGEVRQRLDRDRDLLLIVSPTSPFYDDDVHLGVAIAEGPGFPAGSTLTSATTRQGRLVTLQDVAPTVLDHLRLERPASMLGRPWVAVGRDGARIEEAVALDHESVTMLRWQTPIVAGYVAVQIVVYVAALALLVRAARTGDDANSAPGVRARGDRVVEATMLSIVAFPVASFLANFVDAYEVGAVVFIALLALLDAVIVAVAWIASRDALGRLLLTSAITVGVISFDLLAGGRLQLNALFGNYPTFGGRFTGLGNTAFTVLGATTLLTGALLAQRRRAARRTVGAIAALFGAVVLVDGLPQLGADVGGVIALVPSVGLTFALLAGHRISWGSVALGGALVIAALAVFVAIDLAQPPDSRTHLARLVEAVRAGGWDVLLETVARKLASSLRVFTLGVQTYFVPLLLVIAAYLVSRRAGVGRDLAAHSREARSGLIGILVLGIVGFAVNDSGIVIPALALVFFVPSLFLAYLSTRPREAA